ncbi:PAS domain S-box protein [Mucilaginibacter sp.]|uniref:PAS domain S-box protein n=1 Tax=Mucilaginibacter sp. TaxID=1882438 RepID=UPI003D09CF80
MVNYWWRQYQQSVKGKTISHIAGTQSELSYWQDLLFFNFLFYCLPISFIAVIPGVFMAVNEGYTVIAYVDLISLLLLSIITFSHQIPLKIRKIFIIIIFYTLAIFLINLLGYIGPGVFYLFAITVLIALVFSKRYAYWSILANTLILSFFAAVIRFKLFYSPLNHEYTTGQWIAFSSNLIFLNIILVALINRIFQSLQDTIDTKGHLQQRYKGIFDQSPMPMWIFDTSTLKFLEVNKAAVRHYGYAENEFLQMTIKDIRLDTAISNLEKLVETNRKSGLFYQGDAEHIKKGGERIHVKIESNLLMLDGQEVRLVLATDITDQVKSEREVNKANLKIKRSEASLRAIFESAADGFVLLDHELTIKAFNSKAKGYVQLNKNQTEFEAGRNIYEYIESSKQGYFRSAIKNVFGGEIVEYDRRYRRDATSIQWIRFTLTPVIEDEVVKGVCITGRDVTVRKLYLQNLEDQNKTFREISWMQSHLVRAPLARIMGLIDILKTARDDDFDEAINYILSSAHELDGVINKITVESNTIISKYPIPIDIDPAKSN